MNSKKNFFGMLFLMMMTVFCIGVVSCGDDDDNDISNSSTEPPKDTIKPPIGVWENGKYFISLNDDNFCSAYFEECYIDCGTYSFKDNMIICNNAYYAKQTKYNILELTEYTMKVKIDFIYGDELFSKTMIFSKNEDKFPSVKDHSLVGKSYSSPVYFDGNNTQTWSFETYNTGTRSMKSGAASKYPLSVYYIFFDSKVYYQTYRSASQMSIIGGWGTNTNVSISEVRFSSSGQIYSFTKIQ